MTFAERLRKLSEAKAQGLKQKEAEAEQQRLSEETSRQEALDRKEREKQALIQEFSDLDTFGSQNLVSLLEAVQVGYVEKADSEISRSPQKAEDYHRDSGVRWQLEWGRSANSGNRIILQLMTSGDLQITVGETVVTRERPISVRKNVDWRDRAENEVFSSLANDLQHYSRPSRQSREPHAWQGQP